MSRPDVRLRQGFTLLELLVVMAVIGLLCVLAVPRYQQFVLRAQRSEGQALLIDAAARQIRHYVQNQQYVTDQHAIGQLHMPHTQGSEVLSANRLYHLTVGTGDGGFLLQATPFGAQRADSGCASLLLNGLGTTGTTGTSTPADCWK